MKVRITGDPKIILGRAGIELKVPYDHYIGRYKLYPTENIWTFLMIDVIDGYTFQIQWGFEQESRFIELIDLEFE